jgi:hypothetical protein
MECYDWFELLVIEGTWEYNKKTKRITLNASSWRFEND